jgi:hypothetical protein
MSDKTKDTNKLLKRPLRRRDVLKRGLAGTALVAGSSIFAPRILRAAGGSITIASFQDNAMAPFRDYFIKEFPARRASPSTTTRRTTTPGTRTARTTAQQDRRL